MYDFMIDWGLYLLVILIPLFAQIGISVSYSKYKQRKNNIGLTGAEVARKILAANNLSNVYVVETQGELSDHYDPNRKTVKLSSDIYNGDSIAAMGVAAHECGHAIQDSEGYLFLRIRSMLVPVVNLVSYFSWFVILIGFITEYFEIFYLGIALILIGLVFQLITLPVEFDASNRAKKELERLSLAPNKDLSGVKSILFFAAMTYVASVLSSILQVLRLILLFNNRRD